MKQFIQIPIFLLSFIFIQCCRGQEQKAAASWPNDALQMPEGIKAKDLPLPESESARLTAYYCSQCHGIPSPASHSAADWVSVFRRMMLRSLRSQNMGQMMGGQMGHMMGGNLPMGMQNASVPSVEEQALILGYLQDHALKTVSPEDMPDAEGEGAQAFRQKCSRCHALPAPDLHTATQWPDVVERMQSHMKITHLPELTEDELISVKNYLERNAKK